MFGSWLEQIAIDYNHCLEVNDNLAFIYAVTHNEYDTLKFLGFELGENKNKPFYGYVGRIFIVNKDDRRFDSITWKNNTIGTIVPSKPIIKENNLMCAEGTREVNQ